MKNSTRNLFKISAGISLAISIIFLIYGIALIFNIGGVKDLYIDIILKMGFVEPNEVNLEVYMAIFDAFISVFLNSYCAGVYFKLGKAKSILIGGSRLTMYLGILQCLFLLSILPGVMAIVGSVMLRKEEANIINRPREQQPTNMDIVAERIKDMKDQKDKGNISQEQYDKFLNDIIEKTALDNIKNGEEIEKKETLQDKLKTLKQEKSQDDNNKKDNE